MLDKLHRALSDTHAQWGEKEEKQEEDEEEEGKIKIKIHT
jgi:hypothetical protein